MEKQPKAGSPHGKKRQRKTSLVNASEPKHIIVESSDSPTKIKAPKLSKSKTSKLKTSIAQLEAPESSIKIKPDVPGLTKLKDNIDQGQVNNTAPSKKQKLSKANIKLDKSKPHSAGIDITSPKKKKNKLKVSISEQESPKAKPLESPKVNEDTIENADDKSKKSPKKKIPVQVLTLQEIQEKYPVLMDKDLIQKFMKVPLSNNQKGRIRLAIKSSLQGTANTMFPEIINGKIQGILKSSQDLTDSELRRIRILYNMLKMALENPSELVQTEQIEKNEKEGKKVESQQRKEKVDKSVQKVKGPKRYVVFLGNLPLSITKEEIMEHFRDMNEQIKDIRLPKIAEGKKSAIAYVELSNEPSYELALSKHHSMLGNKRINVLYTTQKKSKISKSEAKSKSAKLIAMQKSGKLVGSTPQGKRRSHRRAIMKQARAKEAAASA